MDDRCLFPLVLFGSQSGNAEEIAKQIRAKLMTKGYPLTRIYSMVDYLKENNDNVDNLANETVVIMVCSTYGNGDPPDNALQFWRKLARRTNKGWLSKVHFTVLGLGDTNYDHFCNMGRVLDLKMAELGATRFYRLGKADDGVGLELEVEPWKKGLAPALNAVRSKLFGNSQLLLTRFQSADDISLSPPSDSSPSPISSPSSSSSTSSSSSLNSHPFATLPLEPAEFPSSSGSTTMSPTSTSSFTTTSSTIPSFSSASTTPSTTQITKKKFKIKTKREKSH